MISAAGETAETPSVQSYEKVKSQAADYKPGRTRRCSPLAVSISRLIQRRACLG